MKSIPFRLKIIDKCQLTNKLVQMNEFQKNAFTVGLLLFLLLFSWITFKDHGFHFQEEML